MAHLIDKDTLVAEIERIKEHDSHIHYDDDMLVNRDMSVRYHLLEYLLDFINTIEVKEVDLESELNTWRHNHFNGRRDIEASGEYLERITQLELAKYFFELGLKTRKGE